MESNDNILSEATSPPDQIWESISSQISHDQTKRLFDLEFIPPASCWDHIQQQITPKRNKIIQFHPSSILKYAAVLTFLIITSIAVFSPSFRFNLIQAIEGNKIKAALPSSKQIIDSNKSHLVSPDSVHSN